MFLQIRPNWPRILVVVCLISIGTGATFLSLMSQIGGTDPAKPSGSIPSSPSPTSSASPESTIRPSSGIPPDSVPSLAPDPPSPEPSPDVPATSVLGVLDIPELILPVAGVRARQLRDTFSDARSQSRVHNALDIMAPHEAAVLAAADGTIVKLHFSDKGGITIYQTSVEEKLIFYYAHLDRYADTLREGQSVRQGETIGYVGDTGNAGAGNYHLHFAIWTITDPKRYWDGVPINPYPLLRNAN
ncbi:MAG: M23 family metallopeptidase [Acidobacteriota bacterium]